MESFIILNDLYKNMNYISFASQAKAVILEKKRCKLTDVKMNSVVETENPSSKNIIVSTRRVVAY